MLTDPNLPSLSSVWKTPHFGNWLYWFLYVIVVEKVGRWLVEYWEGRERWWSGCWWWVGVTTGSCRSRPSRPGSRTACIWVPTAGGSRWSEFRRGTSGTTAAPTVSRRGRLGQKPIALDAQKSWISSSLIVTFHPISHLPFPLIVPIPREVAGVIRRLIFALIAKPLTISGPTRLPHFRGVSWRLVGPITTIQIRIIQKERITRRRAAKTVVVMRKTMGAGSGCRFGRLWGPMEATRRRIGHLRRLRRREMGWQCMHRRGRHLLLELMWFGRPDLV